MHLDPFETITTGSLLYIFLFSLEVDRIKVDIVTKP